MWPPGHLAVAYLCYALWSRRRDGVPPMGLAVVVLAVASQFPDLVDKPLAWYLGVLPTGRTLAHSLLVVVPLSLLAIWLARRYDRPELGTAAAIGALSHVLVDALPVLWREEAEASFLLWPLVAVEGYEEPGAPSVPELLAESAAQPYFLLEFVLLAIALVWWRRDGYPGLGVVRRAIESAVGRGEQLESGE